MAPFWDPLEAFWGFVTLSRPSVSSLWVSLWSFGSDFFCALKPSKVWVLDHLGAARAPLYSFWVAFCAREASSWVLWGALDARLGVPQRFPGTLSMQFGYLLEICLFRSCFCGPWWGGDVQSVHAGACFLRVRQIERDSLLRPLAAAADPPERPKERERGTGGGQSDAGEARRLAKMVPEPSPEGPYKNDKRHCIKSKETSLEREDCQ